ncbi:uncharacterized protein LY79DRAFT_537068 [Colletotrichum navitas]|uniref:Fungal N-terminal domain-containing protein n=1 Tax=Colletotrichum navitas TaxID=681940 RepID=A0AAD8VAI0_9PEZI|nr:uncharacterized protein LY79DRAFT_537068 [Colletotrichum navitas]KAK1599134.1 hypothetical protein LY79DRAFT_537068 [Colletotrichum navitas]
MEAAIGVIGLSLQLIDSAVKVKRAINNYRSASTEIHRLAIKIERVEAVCGAIKKSLEGGPSTRRCSDLIETWGVCVLRSVQSTLAELHDIIAKLEKKAAKKRVVNAAGMAFLLEKDDITRLSKCLDEDLNHLQHMMMTEMFSQCNIVQQLVFDQSTAQVASSIEGLATSLTCPESCTTVSSAEPSVTKTVTTSNRKIISAYGFHGQAQSVRIIRKSRWQNNRETTTSKEVKTYAFGLSGISYRVEFHWHLSMASPVVYAMNIRHVISRTTDPRLLNDIKDAMCDGNLQALQGMLSAGRLTLSSLCGKRTLFEMAVIANQPDVCRFLAQQNSRLCTDEQLCRPDDDPGYSVYLLEPLEIRRRVFEIDDIVQFNQASQVSRFRLLAFQLRDIRSLIELYHRFDKPALDPTEKKDFVNAAWDAVVYCLTFTYGDIDNILQFPDDESIGLSIGLFVELIDEGVDVHRLVSFDFHLSETKEGRYTALYKILTAYDCHRNVELNLSCWLRMLQASRIGMYGYIERETAFCRSLWGIRPWGWRGPLSTKVIEGFEIPFWHRFVDPLGKAYEVRHEFRNWGRLDPNMRLLWYGAHGFLEKLITEDHQLHITMKGREMALAVQDDWPFEYSFVQIPNLTYLNQLQDFGLSAKDQRNIERSYLYARELIKSRFERRQMRKLYKSGCLKREKHILRVPGAWPSLE